MALGSDVAMDVSGREGAVVVAQNVRWELALYVRFRGFQTQWKQITRMKALMAVDLWVESL
jgi:hypothetical protein